MKLRLLVVGKIKEKWMKEGIQEYQKRLGRYCHLFIQEVPDVSDDFPLQKRLQLEGDALLNQLKDQDYVILAHLDGQKMPSKEFAEHLAKDFERSGAQLTWIIAGSHGFDPRIIQRAQACYSLSELTFPHTLTRLLLLEQIYRAFKILNNESYHK